MKIQKVLVDGIHMYDMYPHANSWQVFKYRFIWKPINTAYWFIVRVLKYLWRISKLASAVSIAFVLGAFIYGNYVGITTQSALADVSPSFFGSKDTLSLKVDELKERLAHIVHNGESENRKMKEGEIFSVFDPSDKMKAACMKPYSVRPLDCESYGPYQEKIGTIRGYAMQVYGKEVTQIEAMQIANDELKAKEFFLECSIKVAGCVWNWTAAKNNKVEVEILVSTIRSLQK